MKNALCFTLLAALLAWAAPAPAAAGASGLGAIEIYDRTAGRWLEVHEFQGRLYVAGEPGHEYELSLRNESGGRLLAVTSVDGVNVVTGQTAAPGQTGYVLSPWGTTSVSGWRKSLDEVAAFYFTKHRNSYAARTGRPFDVGVIGVALFRERPPRRDWFGELEDQSRDAAGAAAPEAQSRRSEEPREKLGTGHGRREHSSASRTEFERASDQPDAILAIYYDTRANLVAQGVLPAPRHYAQRRPRPFPEGFVPDP
jgi:hypothetical protein